MFGISLARISLLTGTSLGGGVGVSPTLDLNFRGQGYSAAMAGYTFNQLIDFTRTSAATYVDATGKIVPTAASRNLLTFTQEFDNAGWAKTAATVTANATTAPDGTLTADTVVESTAADAHWIAQTVAAVTATHHVFSVYLKKGSGATAPNWVQLTFGGTPTGFANFNLSTGAVGVASSVTASISSVGSGWYKCSVITAVAAAGAMSVQVAFTNNTDSATRRPSYAGTATSDVYIWGAQLEAVPDANLVLGSELVTNGDFASGSTGWVVPAGWAIGSGVATATTTNASLLSSSSVTAGRTYRVSFDVTSYTAGTLYVRVGTGAAQTVTGAGSKVLYLTATNTAGLEFYGGVITLSLDNISVKEITGTTGMPTDYTRNNGGVYPPRFDYDPVTLAPKGLLIEEQRTNLLLRSEEFDTASWGKTLCSVVANDTISPDGTADADKVTDNAGSGTELSQVVTVTSGATVAHSRHFKYIDCRWVRITIGGATDFVRGWFDIQNGVVGATAVGGAGTSAAIAITPAGNGWYRCTLIGALTGATSYPCLSMTADANSSTARVSGASYHVWGAQLEAGAFATSYIPTVASQVTRTRDDVAITGANFSQWYNQSEGTFVAEFDDYSVGANFTNVYRLDDGTTNNRMSLYKNASATSVGFDVTTGNVSQANALTSTASIINPTKHAAAYKGNDFAASINGGAVVTDTSGTVPSGINILRFGRDTIGAANTIMNGHIRSLRFYPTRLANAQLQALTA